VSSNPITVLVVDDEQEILRAVRMGLVAQGYNVIVAERGDKALERFDAHSPALVILDVMMPGDLDGLDVCREIRTRGDVPIIILSARSGESQKVAALDLGADDYLTKPFGMDEMLARVRAALRRAPAGKAQEMTVFVAGDLNVDYLRRVVTKGGEEVKLTKIEYEILGYLTRNVDRVITHRQLLSAVWGPEYSEDTQLLRVHVGHLRQKIEDLPARPKLIVTEPAVGYRFRLS